MLQVPKVDKITQPEIKKFQNWWMTSFDESGNGEH
jgi:hypothetical protein